MNFKVCSKCGEEFPMTEEFFYRLKRGGLRAECKPCNNKSVQDYQKNNKDKRATSMKKYRRNNKKQIAVYGAEYYQNNKEKEVARGAKYRKNNKEKRRISAVEYYQNNKEMAAICGAKYRKANPDKIAAKNARREAHKLNQTPVLTEAENQQVVDIYEKRKELGSNWHVDHAVPLSKGGLHHPDNLQIVLKKYNLQKGSKLNFRSPTDAETYKFRAGFR